MRNVIFVLLAIAKAITISTSALAGVGGIGGGSTTGKYTEVRVCEAGYEGPNANCNIIRIETEKYQEQLENSKKPAKAACFQIKGEIVEQVPCSHEMEYKIPKFLQKFNDSFKRKPPEANMNDN